MNPNRNAQMAGISQPGGHIRNNSDAWNKKGGGEKVSAERWGGLCGLPYRK